MMKKRRSFTEAVRQCDQLVVPSVLFEVATPSFTLTTSNTVQREGLGHHLTILRTAIDTLAAAGIELLDLNVVQRRQSRPLVSLLLRMYDREHNEVRLWPE